MIQTLKDLLELHFYTVFILGIVVLAFLTIGILLRNAKAVFVPLYFVVLLLGGFIYAIYNRYKYDGLVELILGVYLLIAFIYDVLIYFATLRNSKKYYSIIKASSSSIDSSILVYLNNKGKIIYYTEEILKLLNVDKPKDVKDAISFVNIDGKQLTFGAFLKMLAKPVEEDFSAVIELVNSKEVKLDLAKRKIIKNGKLLGYTLIHKKQKIVTIQVEEKKVQTPNTINLVSEAMALFENNKYYMNKRMQALLGVEEVNNLDEYVYYEDRSQLEKRAKSEGDQVRIYYRLNTKESPVWMQELSKVVNSQVSRVIKETDFKHLTLNFLDQANLINDLKQLLVNQTNFTLVKIYLDNLSVIKDKYGKPFSLVIASKFFGNLKDEIKDFKVYETGYYTYAFVLKNKEVHNEILKDLLNESSKLQNSSVSFNDIHVDIKGYVGIVELDKVTNPTPEVLVELADKMLNLAKDPNYGNDYSIYIPRKKDLEEEFKGLDLSDDFIDKILK